MNKVDVLYKNSNFESSGFKDLLKNCDLSLVNSFTSDEKFSKLLTKASLTKYAIKKQKQNNSVQDSTTELIKNVFKKHPRNFTDNDLMSSDSRESITADDILQTKFQRHKKSFKQIKKQLAFKNSNENIWPKSLSPNNVSNKMKHYSNEIVKALEDSLEINQVEVQKVSEIKSNENVVEKVHKMDKKTVQTETTAYNVNEDILGVNLPSILLKISGWLGELSSVIYAGITLVDGTEDYIMRETRVKEFATRFSRQYDYELSRLLGTLRTLIPRISNRFCVSRVAQNITKSCQIILQAIMQYCAHIPMTLTSIDKKQHNVHLKFHQMLKNIEELFILVKKLGKNFIDVRSSLEIVEEVEKKCSSLMTLIEDKFMKPPLVAKAPLKVEKKKIIPKDNKMSPYQSPYQNQSIEKRLSMYSMSFKNIRGKTLGSKRLNVQSRYRTAGITKPPVSDNINKEKKDSCSNKNKSLSQKRSSQILNDDSSSTHELPRCNEDEIETMVEKDAKNVKNKTNDLLPTNSELRYKVETLLQSWTEISNDKKENSRNNKDMIVTQMLNLFEKAQDESQNLLLCRINSKYELAKDQITVTGSKNAKLICIKDKSVYESIPNTVVSIDSEQKLLKLKTPPIKNATTSNVLQEHNNKDESLSKSPIKKKTLTKVKEKSFINILNYRKDYQVFTSHNHMYRKGRVQPWHISNMIAERLLTNLLFSVLSEINLNQIVEQIYTAEFE